VALAGLPVPTTVRPPERNADMATTTTIATPIATRSARRRVRCADLGARRGGLRREGAGCIAGTVTEVGTPFNGVGVTKTNQSSRSGSLANAPSVSSAQSQGAGSVAGEADDAPPEDRVAFGDPGRC
jgi:hypothetical protein